MRTVQLARPAIVLCILWGAQQQLAAPHTETPTVVVITSSHVEAFDEAVEGVRSGLGSAGRLVIVDLAAPETATQLSGKDARLVVAIGNNALEAASRLGAPVIATMVLRQDLASAQARTPVGAVVLDLSLGDVLTNLAALFPGKTRVGMVRTADFGDVSDAALMAQAKGVGIALTVVDCPQPERLLLSFLELKQHVDFVWCPPDGTLYNGATVKPLIVASLENQLPVAGFSANFVRAGAAAGVYPDYREIGVQTAEMARRLLAGSEGGVSIEGPRKVRLALNQRVTRLLGLRVAQKNIAASGIVVIE